MKPRFHPSHSREPCAASTQPTWETEVGRGCSLKNLLGKGFSCPHIGTAVARERSLYPEAHCRVQCITNTVNNPLFITHPTAFELIPFLYQMCSALEREETLGHTHGLHLALQKASRVQSCLQWNWPQGRSQKWLWVGKSDQDLQWQTMHFLWKVRA